MQPSALSWNRRPDSLCAGLLHFFHLRACHPPNRGTPCLAGDPSIEPRSDSLRPKRTRGLGASNGTTDEDESRSISAQCGGVPARRHAGRQSARPTRLPQDCRILVEDGKGNGSEGETRPRHHPEFIGRGLRKVHAPGSTYRYTSRGLESRRPHPIGACEFQALRLWRSRSSRIFFMSASTMSVTRVAKLVLCRQPSLARALLASPRRESTSVGRK
jgi:hypothetical protein